jgi:hypothetical protein
LIDDPRKIGGAEGYRQLGSQMPGEWLVAYAAETAEGIRPTGLRLLGGRHQFIANAREIMTSLLKQDVRVKLQEGLIGPWRYEDKGLQAWGWDADARIDAASSAKAAALWSNHPQRLTPCSTKMAPVFNEREHFPWQRATWLRP